MKIYRDILLFHKTFSYIESSMVQFCVYPTGDPSNTTIHANIYHHIICPWKASLGQTIAIYHLQNT